MLTNSGVRPMREASRPAISTSKPTRRSSREGSASTNGAPPSGSPAQRKTRGACAATTLNAEPAEIAETAETRITDMIERVNNGVYSIRRHGADEVVYPRV